MESVKPVAVVTPWFGRELKGGAEQYAWQIAVRLRARGYPVEVLTTCCRSFQEDWATNHLPTGVTEEQGVTIRRFPVVARDKLSFDEVNVNMLNLTAASLRPGINPVSQGEAALFTRENINSSALLDYLRDSGKNYRVFIFIPYLYGPILNGLSLVADRAFLHPCLHDEVYAYLPQVEHCFRTAKGLLFNSEGEAFLACRLYGPGILSKSVVVGGGVELTPGRKEETTYVKDLSVGRTRFVLYLGRRDPTKNVDLLISAYTRFKNAHPDSSLKLVLAGPGSTSFHNAELGLYDLGLVSEEEKAALLTHCLALFQPSRNESYSRVLMEAWLCGRPVAAHQRCLATAIVVAKAQGGWLAETETEWVELFAKVENMSEEELEVCGIEGRQYARENAVWDKVIERYERALGLCKQIDTVAVRRKRRLAAIHQLLPGFAYGDAISNHALSMRDHLRSLGYHSEIFVCYLDPRMAYGARLFTPRSIEAQAGIIYHHSIGSELTPYAIQHKGPKCLVYHNITPAEFFAPYQPALARELAQGRADLQKLAGSFSHSVGVSVYNVAELVAYGFQDPQVMPLVVDPARWNIRADEGLMRQLQDGLANILFVGRIAPNKRQDHLVEAFAHYLTLDDNARLILAGNYKGDDPYYQFVMNYIEKLNLGSRVILTGLITDQQLSAFYRTASLLWSMSEHEGFCVPMAEAMWFDVPILAYKSTATPETLGEAGLLFSKKDNLLQVAALAKLLIRDENLRAKMCVAQRKRREAFLPEAVWRKFEAVIDRMEEGL